MGKIHLKFIIIVSIALAASYPCAAVSQVTADPHGLAVGLDADSELETGLTLTNSGGEDVSFRIRLQDPPEEDRDRRGQEDDFGYYWVDSNEDDGPDYNWLDLPNLQGAQRLNAQNNWNSGVLELGFDFPWYGEWYPGIRMCTNGWITFDEEQAGTFSNLPRFPNEQAPNNMLAVNCTPLTLTNQSSMWFWTDGESRAAVSWVMMAPPLAPIRPDLNMQIVLDAETGVVLYQYGNQLGLQANTTNLGYENEDGSLGASINFQDGGPVQGLAIAITGPISRWLTVTPDEGEIAAEEDQELTLLFNSAELEAGTYELRANVEMVEVDHPENRLTTIQMSMVMTVEEDVATILGRVTPAGEDSALTDVEVSLDRYRMLRVTNNDGEYEFADLPLGAYELIFTRDEYLPHSEEINLEDAGDHELDVALLHGECSPNPEGIDARLRQDTSRDFAIEVTNGGNGPLTYTVERRLPGGADVEPWEQRFDYQTGQEVEDNRLKGVTFVDGSFYVTGTGDEQTMIYVLDRDGALIRSFPQVGTARNGMDGLAWDGELLWGSGENRVFGFTTEGDSVTSFRGEARTTRPITWDPVNELLWTADATSDIYAMDRGGGDAQMTLNRRGQTIHALTFYMDDPDGFQLYVLSTLDDTLAVRKMNIDNGEVRFVAMLESAEGGEPSGACIASDFDFYSTVFIGTIDIPEEDGGDRIGIWQVQGNNSWMLIDPAEGVIEADQTADFTLTLDATGLALLPFEGELTWVHDGFGRETVVDILMQVTGEDNEPPGAFNLLEPADGDTLPEGDADFIWERSIDPDPQDTVRYDLWFEQGEETAMHTTSDTVLTIPLAELGLEQLDVHLPVQWWVVAVSVSDRVECNARFGFYLPGAGVDDNPSQPAEFALYGVHPNPFNSQATVEISLDVRQPVALRILNIQGRLCDNLSSGALPAGRHRIAWDASRLPAGIYLVELATPGRALRIKALLVR